MYVMRHPSPARALRTRSPSRRTDDPNRAVLAQDERGEVAEEHGAERERASMAQAPTFVRLRAG